MSSHRLLLITSNLGSVFEKADIEQAWASELEKFVNDLAPEVVAIHCQEIGGKDWETTMPKVPDFISKLHGLSCFSQFSRVRVFVDTESKTEGFTALGNIYLIHDSVPALSIWNFHTKQFQEVAGKEFYCGKKMQECQYVHKERFPNDYFPLVKWSRKGFLLTKWKFQDGPIINFSNIHLFHDDDNLVALEQSPSVYTKHRRQALQHAMDKIHSLEVSSTTGNHQEAEPLFIYGDFNFRLDLSAVIKHILKEDTAAVEKFFNGISSSNGTIDMEAKKFVYRGVQFTEQFLELRPLDKESDYFEDLIEEPIKFQPSYPFSESCCEGSAYMTKRCPAWCDRILMNPSANRLLEQSSHPRQYNLIAKGVCVGDHKPVFLSCTLQSSVPKKNSSED